MKLERDTTTCPGTRATTARRNVGVHDWMNTPRTQAMRARLTGGAPRFIARAPGRLDVIGGFADYAGASIVYLPTGECAHVAIQARDDDKIFVTDITSTEARTHEPTVVDSAALLDGHTHASAALAGELADHGASGGVRSVLGTLAEAVAEEAVANLGGGFSVVVHAGSRALECAGRQAAISAGALAALTGAADAHIDIETAGRIVRRVAHKWFDAPIGVGDGVCAWCASASVLNTFRCDSETGGDPIPLPPGVSLVGLHCGMRRADALEKFRRARVATLMGCTLIRRIVDAEHGAHPSWGGFLSEIDVAEYVERFRDRVPTKMTGRDFLRHFAVTIEHVDRDATYKIRSRTEHHIYEHARSTAFINLAARAAVEPTTDLLANMGDVMYASHWSYGQRCGLGSVETDLLVNLIRQRGAPAGLYGARVSGRGCGGVVTVLLADTDAAFAALGEASDAYSAKTGNVVTSLRGSLPGATVTGVCRF